jgi:hypothetical protein
VGRGERHTGFWWGHLKERDQLKHQDVDGRIILIWILKKYKRVEEGGDWIDLAQDSDKWRCALKAWMNLRVLYGFCKVRAPS